MRTTRAAVSSDWAAVWPLLVGMGVKDTPERVREAFVSAGAEPRWLIVVADEQGTLIGYAAAQDYGPPLRAPLSGRIARLHDLYVDPAHRRRGVARELMSAVTSWAATRVAYLQWQAHEGEAAAFYEALGHRGDPCPQPDFPGFEIVFPAAG